VTVALLPGDEGRHPQEPVEEWLFTCWAPDGSVGIVTGYRIVSPSRGWYWAALARAGKPLLHVVEWDVPLRSNPLLVKSAGLWAEHICDDPFRQWTVSNETFASALDDPDEGLGRAYGTPTAIAFDLEWYADGGPDPLLSGYQQHGEVHGVVEFASEPALHLDGVPAWRSHRWGLGMAPVALPPAIAHVGLRAAFAFPDGTAADWVLTTEGWRGRA
jgi:hypothetical protein